MQMNSLKRVTPNTKHVQVGRGGKRGKTAGRGTKGQNARSGHRKRPELRDLIKKIPKKRGYGKNRAISAVVTKNLVPVNVRDLETKFNSGEAVNIESLLAKGVLRNARQSKAGVKILGTGELTKSLVVSGVTVSESAKAKIVAAGGSIA